MIFGSDVRCTSSTTTSTTTTTVHRKVVLILNYILVILATFGTIIPCQVNSMTTFNDWDLAVAQGKNVIFISVSNNESSKDLSVTIPSPLLFIPIPKAENISNYSSQENSSSSPFEEKKWHLGSLAFDPSRELLFYTQISKHNVTIGLFDMLQNSSQVLYQGSNMVIQSIVFHQNYLYWTDERQKKINCLNLTNLSEINPPRVIRSYPVNSLFKPHSIAIDPTNKTIYWADWKKDSPSIKYLNGDSDEIFVVGNLYQPHALTIDFDYLYWTDNPPGIHFTIERVLLKDANVRQVIYKGQHQHPFSVLSISSRNILWTDILSKTIVELVYDGSEKNISTSEIGTFRIYQDLQPFGLILNSKKIHSRNVVDGRKELKNSEIVKMNQNNQNHNNIMWQKRIDIDSDTTNHTGFNSLSTFTQNYNLSFCQDIIEEKNNDSMVSLLGQSRICQNGATCLLFDGKKFCLCEEGFTGPNCEILWPLKTISPATSSITASFSLLTTIVCGILSFLLLIACITSIILFRRVKKLDQKPKIRRRVIVSRNSTSEQSSSGGLGGTGTTFCEMIDIENCCNMNVCETPCYERNGSQQFSSASTSNGNNKTIKKSKNNYTSDQKEDKERLLEIS